MAQIPLPVFYVYEHRRRDNGVVFYVGKGSKNRAFVKSFGNHHANWNNVVTAAKGFEVTFVKKNLSEAEAYALECEHIALLRSQGVQLCNLTNGGIGGTGAKRSESWKKKISAVHKGKVLSVEVRKKISDSVKACGFQFTEEMKKKISDTHKGHHRLWGRHTEAWKHDQSERAKGNRSRTGQKRSTEERLKSSLALRGRKQKVIECSICKKTGGNSLRRYHFENCKFRNSI